MRGKRVWHFARKRRGYRPTFFFAKSTWEASNGEAFLPLFPSSPIFSFSPFLSPHSDVTRMLGSLSKGAVVCAVCLGFPGGSHLFRIGTSHPFLGIAHRVSNPNPDSMGYPVGFWGFLGVVLASLGSPQWAFNPNPNPREPLGTLTLTLGNPRKPSEHPAHTPLASTHGRLLHSSLLMSRGTWP